MNRTIKKVGCSPLSKAAMTAVILTSMAMGAEAQDALYALDEVVVTATKTENTVKDVPEAAEVFTREDFRQAGAQDVRGALRLAASLDTSSSGMVGNAVSVRGMGSDRTLILIDGRRMASEDTAETANAYELDRIALSAVERIEVVRGNASALYGSDALGGVINIITRRPEKAGLTAGIHTGSHLTGNDYRYDLGEMGRFNGAVSASFQKVRPYSFNDSGDTSLYGPRQNFSVDGTYKLSDTRRLGLNLGYMKDHMRMDYAESRFSRDKYQNIDSTRKSASFDYHAETGASDFMIRAYYNQLEKENRTYNKVQLISLAAGDPAVIPKPLSAHVLFDYDHAKYDTFVIEGRDTTRLSDTHRLTAGGEYRHLAYSGTRLNQANSMAVNAGDKTPLSRSMDTYAVYLQDEWTPSARFVITPSVRYDHSGRFGSSTAPKIGMTYKIRDNLRVKANYGRGFRAPTLSELYLYFDGSSMAGMPGAGRFYITGNPDLKPEKSLGYDFRVEWEPGRAFGSVSYYHNDVENLITTVLAGYSPITYRYTNIGRARVAGVETAAGYRLDDRWTIKGTWNYLDAIDKDTGERISGRASHYGTVQLLYSDHQDYGWSGAFWYEFTRDYFGGDQSRTEMRNSNYHLLNLSVSRKWGDRISAFAGLDNLTNKKSDFGLYLNGRLWRTGVEWKF